MKKLSEKEYWDSIYQTDKQEFTPKDFTFFYRLKNWLKHISRDYSNYLIWEKIYPKYLPKSSDYKVIEVGCAPGGHLIGLHKKFGYIPYGVEYSESGCALTKNNFAKNGLSESNVIQADFFDKNFQSNQSNLYDLVISLGFIEHFDNIPEVVNGHINLLKESGYLVILIPNLSGLNYFTLKFLNLDSLAIHNTSTMNKQKFKKLFENRSLEFLFCDYVGTFSFGLFNTNKKWKYYMWRILLIFQRPFDFFWRVIFRDKYIRSQYSSPYLLFIGRKNSWL